MSSNTFDPSLLSPDGTQNVPVSVKAAVQGENTVTMPKILTMTEPVETTVPVNVNAQSNNTTQVNITANYQTNPFPGRALEDFGIQTAYEFPTAVTVMPFYTVMPKFAGTNSDFGIRSVYTAHTTVSVQVHYVTQKDHLPNFTSGIRQARGGIIGKNGVMGFATGWMVCGGAQIVTVAEEGTPEMIIPLGVQRRQRGLDLWEKAGHMLGVPGYANGGIVGRTGEQKLFSERGRWKPEFVSSRKSEPSKSVITAVPQNQNSAPISVTVGNITLQIESSGSDENIIQSIEN